MAKGAHFPATNFYDRTCKAPRIKVLWLRRSQWIGAKSRLECFHTDHQPLTRGEVCGVQPISDVKVKCPERLSHAVITTGLLRLSWGRIH